MSKVESSFEIKCIDPSIKWYDDLEQIKYDKIKRISINKWNYMGKHTLYS